MIEAAEETKNGSYFVAQEKGLRTQKQWLAFYAQSQGSIWVDKGAAGKLSLNMARVFSYLVSLKQKDPFLTVIS